MVMPFFGEDGFLADWDRGLPQTWPRAQRRRRRFPPIFPNGFLADWEGPSGPTLFADTVPENRQYLYPSLFPESRAPRMDSGTRGTRPSPERFAQVRDQERLRLPDAQGRTPPVSQGAPMHIPFGDPPPYVDTLEINRGLKKGTQGPGVGQYEVVPLSGTKTKGRATRKRLNRSR
jgi:hypothetical protein